MKKIWFILIPIIIFTFAVFAYYWYRYSAMFRILQDDSLSEAEVASLVESKKGQDLNLLVAYFSYTGTTHGIVEEIRFKIGADLFCIEREEDYSDVYTESRLEIWHNDCPNLKNTVENMDQYDVVFIGFPIWFHATPAPVNTFLESYDLTGKIIIPLCTSGGSDIEEAIHTFFNSCRNLAVYQERRISNSSEIDSWLANIDLF